MIQQMAHLPRSRMVACKPSFSYSDMDLFGPLHVEQSETSVLPIYLHEYSRRSPRVGSVNGHGWVHNVSTKIH